jgi:hypothetical protein
MKPIVTVLLAIAVGLISVAAPRAQEDMQVVANDVFRAPQRPPSVFRHDEHNAAAAIDACQQCHHIYRDGRLVEDESSEDQRCSDCHAETAQGRQPALMDAFHGNCKQCHLENGKGPIMCGECHRRQGE